MNGRQALVRLCAEERRRWVVLFPDCLVYYRDYEDDEPAGVMLFEVTLITIHRLYMVRWCCHV